VRNQAHQRGAERVVRRGATGAMLAAAVTLLVLAPIASGRTSQTFTTLGQSTFTVPAGVTQITIEARGGQGGGGSLASCEGGAGAGVTGDLTVTPGQQLYVEVGGAGGDGWGGRGEFGGVNGGGDGAAGGYASGGGGGASDVRTLPTSNGTTLGSRLLVAGGGGGGGGAFPTTPGDTTPGCFSTGGSVGGTAAPTAWPAQDETSAGAPGQFSTGGGPGNQLGPGAGGTSQACAYVGNDGLGHPLPNGDSGVFGRGGKGVGAVINSFDNCDYSGGGGGGGWWGGGGGGADQAFGTGGGAGSNYTAPSVTNGTITQAPFSPFTPFPGQARGAPPLNGSVTISLGPRAATALSLSAPTGGTKNVDIEARSISATLSGGSSPGGTITFKVFGPQASAPTDCSGGKTVGTATVSDNGTYHPSSGLTPAASGNYWWYASYGADSENKPSSSPCGATMPKTVVADTGLSLSVPASGAQGTAIPASSITGTLSGGALPTGTITFRVFGPAATAPTSCPSSWQLVGTAIVLGNGAYHPPSGFTPASGGGNYWWYASYSGDGNNGGSSSTCGTGMAVTVVPAVTSLSSSAPTSGTAGVAIPASSITGTLSGGASPTGTITFRVFGPQASAPTDCSSGSQTYGTASVSGNGTYHPSLAFTPSTVGTFWWYATYGGDAENDASSSACGAAMGKLTVT
jgi:hypothetical protein